MTTIQNLSTSSISSKTPVRVMAPPSAVPTTSESKISGIRSAFADSLRAVGNGYNQSSEHIGVASDKGYIYPIETAYAAATAVKKATAKVPIAQKVGGGFFSALGFISAFHGMIISGVLRSPGDVVRDATHGIADKIDGKKTLNGEAQSNLRPIVGVSSTK